MTRREKLAWAALLALALLVRVWGLGDMPPHHDEAVHAHFADVLITQHAYRYDPTYHGPLLFYTMGALFLVLGESLSVARLYPALAGVALAALPIVLRRRIGARAAWWSGLLLAASPSFVYYSRFARNDVPVALFTAAALVLLVLVRRRGGAVIPWVGVLAAMHAISKETFYVTCPLLAGGGAAVALRDGLRRSAVRTREWLGRHAFRVGTAILWFVAITIAAYTFGFVHPEDFAFPVKAISYWYAQHQIQRVGGPWHYHLPRLALYEFAIAVPALVWAVRRRARMGRLEIFCLTWGVLAICMYAYLGEKTPWLLVHQVLPLVPLAGAQLARTFSSHGAWWSRVPAAVAVAATLWSTTASSFLYPTITTSDPHAELIVFVQTTPEGGALAREGLDIARGRAGRAGRVGGGRGIVAAVVAVAPDARHLGAAGRGVAAAPGGVRSCRRDARPRAPRRRVRGAAGAAARLVGGDLGRGERARRRALVRDPRGVVAARRDGCERLHAIDGRLVRRRGGAVTTELSVVLPVLDEEANIPEVARRLLAVLPGAVSSFEIIFVDDGSTDRTWEIVGELAGADSRIKGVSFSRNFGHQMAFAAGLDHATGDAVVIMDADGQDPPELLPELVSRWREGYDVVYAVRASRAGGDLPEEGHGGGVLPHLAAPHAGRHPDRHG